MNTGWTIAGSSLAKALFAFCLLVNLAVLTPASASANDRGIGIRDFKAFRTVDSMGRELIDSRGAVDDVLFTMSAAQTAVRRAEKEKEEAVSRHGLDSHDAAVAEGRLRSVRREQLAKTLRSLQSLVPRIKEAEVANKRRARKLIGSNFDQLVTGYLKSQRNPPVLAMLVYLATKRLSDKAGDLYANVLLGKLDADLEEVSRTLDLVSKLVHPSATTVTIDEAWRELSGNADALAPGSNEFIDDLDALIQEKE